MNDSYPLLSKCLIVSAVLSDFAAFTRVLSIVVCIQDGEHCGVNPV